MIDYDMAIHPNGKFRIIENVNGDKRFLRKGKRKFFDEEEAEEILLERKHRNERKAKLWVQNKKTRVNI